MKKGLVVLSCFIAAVGLFTETAIGQVCVSPSPEHYMANPLAMSCSEIYAGIEFINPVDGLDWTVNITDESENVLNPLTSGTPFYFMITGTGYWGTGYMPHLYAPGNYSGTPMTWRESWVGSPDYSGSANGDIVDLDDIINLDPITVYEPNLVLKTSGFADATGYNTLIVAQEQVFLGWWGGPWTEPDGEIITWIFGPFILDNPESFYLRILVSPVYNDDLYIADFKLTACMDNDGDGYYLEAEGCVAPYDCNDWDGSINPGVEEVAGDSDDENCDGYVACDPGVMNNNGEYMSCMAHWKNDHK